MGWQQFLISIGSVALGFFMMRYYIISRDLKSYMNKMDEKFLRMESFHRIDMIRLERKWDAAIVRMDEKWERLFERLLIQGKK